MGADLHLRRFVDCWQVILIASKSKMARDGDEVVIIIMFVMPTFLEMENVQNKHVSETQSSFPMKLVDQRIDSRVDNGIITRRLKNRERQRRYRARKRLEEEIRKASTVEQPTQTEMYVQLSEIAKNSSARVHCIRNWKKEARRAIVSRESEASCDSLNMAVRMLTGEGQMQCLPSNVAAKPQLETQSHLELPADQLNSVTPKKVLGRRDWKADARKKTN